MKFVEKIIKHPVYIEILKELEKLEEARIFCCHGLPHLMDVARIAYIYDLEQALNIEKEVIYLAALLHDIGRVKEYREGIPHEQASREMAEVFLKELQYPIEKIEIILTAIEGHRNKDVKESCFRDCVDIKQEIEKNLAEKSMSEKLRFVINMADKKSRNCFFCGAYEQCNWGEDKKNKVVTF